MYWEQERERERDYANVCTLCKYHSSNHHTKISQLTAKCLEHWRCVCPKDLLIGTDNSITASLHWPSSSKSSPSPSASSSVHSNVIELTRSFACLLVCLLIWLVGRLIRLFVCLFAGLCAVDFYFVRFLLLGERLFGSIHRRIRHIDVPNGVTHDSRFGDSVCNNHRLIHWN